MFCEIKPSRRLRPFNRRSFLCRKHPWFLQKPILGILYYEFTQIQITTNWDHHGCSYCDRHLLQVQPNRTRQDRRNNSKQEIPTGTGSITWIRVDWPSSCNVWFAPIAWQSLDRKFYFYTMHGYLPCADSENKRVPGAVTGQSTLGWGPVCQFHGWPRTWHAASA